MAEKFRRLPIAVADIAIFNLSLFLAFMLRYDWYMTAKVLSVYYWLIIWMPIIRISVLQIFDLYNWPFRYASTNDAVNLWKGVSMGSVLLMAFVFMCRQGFIGRSVLLIDYVLCLFFMFGFRFFARWGSGLERQVSPEHAKRVLIIGAGAAGEIVARELVNTARCSYRPVGFIDDDPRKSSLKIHGIKVLGGKDDIPAIVAKHKVDEIIVAIPSAPGGVIRDIISHCQKLDVKFKIVPGLKNILEGKVDIRSIRDVRPEDLLGRAEVRINNSEIKAFLRRRSILVTGAGGSIGSELARQIALYEPSSILLLDHNENDVYFLDLELRRRFPGLSVRTVIGDVRDEDLLNYVFSGYGPEVVFHAAAHKHVPLMQENAAAAVKNNILATMSIIEAASRHGVDRFVFISTDKAVNPTSVMGASKRIAEMLIQAEARRSKTKFMAVRFGNVIGSAGSVVQLFKRQIEEGGPLTVTHPDVKRYFMTVSEAVQLVIQAGAMGNGGEVFILDMGEQVKITDLAKNLITLSGLDPERDISIEFIGLRCGEKLHEDMLLDKEHDRVTKNEKIYVSQPIEFDPRKLRKDVQELETLSAKADDAAIIGKMKEMIPFHETANH